MLCVHPENTLICKGSGRGQAYIPRGNGSKLSALRIQRAVRGGHRVRENLHFHPGLSTARLGTRLPAEFSELNQAVRSHASSSVWVAWHLHNAVSVINATNLTGNRHSTGRSI